jgi:sulfite reductase beta subunit-like hemoprotein
MSAEAPVKLTHNEDIKDAIPTLAGTIAATLADACTDHFSEDDNQFLKFHGSYQQDDRDLRKTGKKYIMMVRGRIPGGVMTAKQWSACSTMLASVYGNNTLRITTRQSIQFHGIVKSGLRRSSKASTKSLLSTLAACGDVNRNVLAPPTPAYTKAREQVLPIAKKSRSPSRRRRRRITPSGLTACNSSSTTRRTKISLIRFTAKRICRANSRSPSSFRPSMTSTFSRTASASSPSWKTTSSSATTRRRRRHGPQSRK